MTDEASPAPASPAPGAAPLRPAEASPAPALSVGVQVGTLVLATAALAASAMLLVDYLRPQPVFCGDGGGCEKVRQTIFAMPLGIPLPAIGVAACVVHVVLALVPGRRARLAALGWACATGLVAAFLIAIQKIIGQICVFCMITDGSTLGILALAALRARGGWDAPRGFLLRGVAGVASVAALATPVAWGVTRPPPPPPPVDDGPTPQLVLDEIAKAPPGQIVVVDFADFECPWCRKAHVDLTAAMERRKGQVHVVRKHVPLSIHLRAKPAARAAICAEEQGKGEAMAELLFSAPPKEIDGPGCEALAEKAGLELDKYKACVADPKTDERIRRDREAFEAARGKALPTMFIGEERLSGYKGREAIEAALAKAASRVRTK